jgi:hypothetical protein
LLSPNGDIASSDGKSDNMTSVKTTTPPPFVVAPSKVLKFGSMTELYYAVDAGKARDGTVVEVSGIPLEENGIKPERLLFKGSTNIASWISSYIHCLPASGQLLNVLDVKRSDHITIRGEVRRGGSGYSTIFDIFLINCTIVSSAP